VCSSDLEAEAKSAVEIPITADFTI